MKKINDVCDNALPEISTNIPTDKLMKLFWEQKSIKIADSVSWPYTWMELSLTGYVFDVPITLESML